MRYVAHLKPSRLLYALMIRARTGTDYWLSVRAAVPIRALYFWAEEYAADTFHLAKEMLDVRPLCLGGSLAMHARQCARGHPYRKCNDLRAFADDMDHGRGHCPAEDELPVLCLARLLRHDPAPTTWTRALALALVRNSVDAYPPIVVSVPRSKSWMRESRTARPVVRLASALEFLLVSLSFADESVYPLQDTAYRVYVAVAVEVHNTQQAHHGIAEELGCLQPHECRPRGRVPALECAFDSFVPSLEKRERVALMIQPRPARVHQTLHEMHSVLHRRAHCKRARAASQRGIAASGTIDRPRFDDARRQIEVDLWPQSFDFIDRSTSLRLNRDGHAAAAAAATTTATSTYEDQSRVVQASTLQVVGCVLMTWLASKGFAVGGSSSSSTNESKHGSLSAFSRENGLSRLLSATLLGSRTPTGTVIVPGRDRSGTLGARHIWDVDVGDRSQELPMPGPTMSRSRTVRGRVAESATPSASTSRPDTETEEDTDVELETSMTQDQDVVENMPPLPSLSHPRRTAVSDTLDVDLDAHIIINAKPVDGGVSDGIVALDQNVNDDLAMGIRLAPPARSTPRRAHERIP
ncbi:hypothetical protein DFH11DRAFT_1833933 [Phellopilus nigrolimitatus]|nr:hypothetical protein DFH11DRAFT_1833933 [Phellopilus nigrolimitatus]